jgi:hypothetical protein
LYYASDLAFDNLRLSGAVGLFYLPAFIRLLGLLVIGLWIIPALLLASLFLVATGAYDLGPGHMAELFIIFCTSFGGPIAAFGVARMTGLASDLRNLTPLRLLVLSIACSLGNAIAYGIPLRLIDGALFTPKVYFEIFVGDMIGSWLIIYLIKFASEAYARRAQR